MKYLKYFISIDQNLFNELEKVIENHNKHLDKSDESKIQIDKAVFLIHYIENQKSYRRKQLVSGYIRIPSKILNAYLKKELKKYKDFLKNKGFLELYPYASDKGESFGYKIIYPKKKCKNKSKKLQYNLYEFVNLSFEKHLIKVSKKINTIEHNKRQADRTTKHLTKWINEKEIKIDWKSALLFINKLKLSDNKKIQYSYSVNNIRFENWFYSRRGSDNRLHSNLTNLPKVLRKFISHKNNKLVSLDVKSSQPYLLAGILNLILKTNVEKLNYLRDGLKCKQVRNKFTSIMNSETLQDLSFKGFRDYINIVCNKDIYTHIGDNLSTEFLNKIKRLDKSNNTHFYVCKTYDSSLDKKRKKKFDDLRTFCKVLALEFMYCSVENYELRIKEIKRIYPEALVNFITSFKYCKELDIKKNKRTKLDKYKIIKAKKLFPKFLQQLESFIILDLITKELSKLYPSMFLATIHDSIIVTKPNENIVRKYLDKRLFELFDIKAEVKSENW